MSGLETVFQSSCSIVSSEASSAKDPRNFFQSLSSCIYAVCLSDVCKNSHLSALSYHNCKDFLWSNICPDWFCVTQMNDRAWSCLTARTHIYQCAAPNDSRSLSLSCGSWMDLLWNKLAAACKTLRWLWYETFNGWELIDRGQCPVVNFKCRS